MTYFFLLSIGGPIILNTLGWEQCSGGFRVVRPTGDSWEQRPLYRNPSPFLTGFYANSPIAHARTVCCAYTTSAPGCRRAVACVRSVRARLGRPSCAQRTRCNGIRNLPLERWHNQRPCAAFSLENIKTWSRAKICGTIVA